MDDPARRPVPHAALVAKTQPGDWEFRGKGSAHAVAAYVGDAQPELVRDGDAVRRGRAGEAVGEAGGEKGRAAFGGAREAAGRGTQRGFRNLRETVRLGTSSPRPPPPSPFLAQRGWLLRVPLSPAAPTPADVAIWGGLLGSDVSLWPERYLDRVVRLQATDRYLPETSWVAVPRDVGVGVLSGAGAELAPGSASAQLGGWLVRDAARVADVPSRCRACVEIKPKCGAVSSCWTVPPSDRALKRSVPRYRLHQALKGELHARRGAGGGGAPAGFVPSAYDPVDLFSRNPAKVLCALQALRASPQNNLAGRLWTQETGRDGRRAETLRDVGFDAVAAAAFQGRDDAPELLVEALRDVLCSEGAQGPKGRHQRLEEGKRGGGGFGEWHA